MKTLNKGNKGFTLVELLIVIAILGVLAAVVIPNMGRFLKRGETEAASTELAVVEAAVASMMTDNKISTLPTPVLVATPDMEAFPDTSPLFPAGGKRYDINGDEYIVGDKAGYILYRHDYLKDGGTATTANYVSKRYTKHKYSVNATGTVTQTLSAP